MDIRENKKSEVKFMPLGMSLPSTDFASQGRNVATMGSFKPAENG